MHISRTRAFVALLVAGAAAVAIVATAAQARSRATAATVTYTFSTATNEIGGFLNQGWWTSNVTNSDDNTNYFVSNDNGGILARDYFSFDISTAINPCPPSSAYLTISDPGTGFGATFLTYGLFDVFTPAAVLAAKHNNPSTAIYNDLGSGTGYGTYVLPTAPSGAYTLSLNANGLSAIGAAHAAHATFFSIGGSLIGAPVGAYLLGFTGTTPVTLTATFPKICRVA